MNFDYIEENIIFKYWETLKRKNILNIPSNKFIKKPYLEKYIINLSTIIDNNILLEKIIELIDSNEITNEELLLFIKNKIELSNDEKKNLEKLILKNDSYDNNINKIYIEVILYEIKYFRFYLTITELLFDSKSEDNELYNFILIFIKNKNSEIKKYIKKNFKFSIFHYYINNLYYTFEKLYNLLIKLNLIEDIEKKEILNLFLKNLFNNWYIIYKKDIIDNNVNDKIKDYIIPKSILSRILCLPNL
jgi:hypothetical protein